MSSTKVVLSLLAGVATGALLGILFAPRKGADTRKKISKKGSDYADTLKQHITDFIDSMSEKFEHEEEKISDNVENMKTNTEKATKN